MIFAQYEVSIRYKTSIAHVCIVDCCAIIGSWDIYDVFSSRRYFNALVKTVGVESIGQQCHICDLQNQGFSGDHRATIFHNPRHRWTI